MPKEVAEALKRQGRWKEGEGKVHLSRIHHEDNRDAVERSREGFSARIMP